MGEAGEGQYSQLGVDARKGGFGRMFTAVAPEAFPHAFCKMYINPVTGDVELQHSDGVGSKSVQRYLLWRETGDASVFEGDADDCIEMNLGDAAYAGLMPVKFTDNISINKRKLPKEVYVPALNRRIGELLELYASHGMPFLFVGGETADLPDQVRTYVLDGTLTARAPKDRAVTCENIAPGDIIYGFASGGRCRLEGEPNSGIMSNGLTLARHCLMLPEYEVTYPEIKDPEGKGYTGRHKADSPMGRALISPTRHFSIIAHTILRECGGGVHGLVLNTGGGQTKITRVGNGIHYVKDNLPAFNDIFKAVMDASGESLYEMFKVFNMGIGLDVIGDPGIEPALRDIGNAFGVSSQRTGFCEAGGEGNTLLIKYDGHELAYEAE